MLAVRWLHVLAMATMLGGALLLALARERPLAQARAYEAAFWAAAGVAVLTGVGNVGEYGEGVPVAATRWGRALGVKLALVGALLVGSALRTLVVSRGAAPRGAYASTAAALAVIALVAEVLAHG